MKTLFIANTTVLFISAFVFFTSKIWLYSFLDRKGIKTIFGLTGLPFYLESKYLKATPSIRNKKGDIIMKFIWISGTVVVTAAVIETTMAVLSH